MKKILLSIISLAIFFIGWQAFTAYWYTAKITFGKDSIKVNETVDMTITIYDDNGNIAKDFQWEIMIVETTKNKSAKLPQETNNWIYKFENKLLE